MLDMESGNLSKPKYFPGPEPITVYVGRIEDGGSNVHVAKVEDEYFTEVSTNGGEVTINNVG